jgi:signal transduction histidine kinase
MDRGACRDLITVRDAGLGMGLAISRSIVKRHGVRLWTAAKTPDGAVLQFTLPTGRAA